MSEADMTFDVNEVKPFEITGVAVESPQVTTAWQVIVKVMNNHGVGVSGKVYAKIGAATVVSQLIGVLPGETRTFDFRDPKGPITRIWTEEWLCAHKDQHVFSFSIDNPKNGAIYAGVLNL